MKKTKRRVYSPLTVNEKDMPGENLDYETVVTVPDQALSVRELINNFTVGQPIDGGKPVYYDEGEDFEDDPTMRPDFDLVDAEELAEDIKAAREKAKPEEEPGDSQADDQAKNDDEPNDDEKPGKQQDDKPGEE